MGLSTIPAPTTGATRNVQVFLSSTTWTVPSSAQYVDVLVVGGGCGGKGGYRRALATDGNGCYGGAIVMAKDVYLGGTGSVAVTVGSGSNGTTGSSTSTATAEPGNAGFSAFGTIYAGGGTIDRGGVPGYKGTVNLSGNAYAVTQDTTQTNWGPSLLSSSPSGFQNFGGGVNTGTSRGVALGLNVFGLYGGGRGAQCTIGELTNKNVAGGSPGTDDVGGTITVSTNTISQGIPSAWLIGTGSATAGTAGTSGGAGGAAGIAGIGGGGGTTFGIGGVGGQGGPGAGGGGSMPGSAGGNGGSGGNAGANTGGGGGQGANTGSTSAGTGGNGGNGGSGLVVVSWIS